MGNAVGGLARTKGLRWPVMLACCTMAALLMAAAAPRASAKDAETRHTSRAPYLIIHLDALSAQLFFSEYDAGRLPNVEHAFSNGKVVRNASSLFPAGTESLYPRLKNLGNIEDPYPVAWEYYDRSTDSVHPAAKTFMNLFLSVPSYARVQFITGIPGMDALAGIALLNTPRMLRDYPIVEFFWFGTDASGHVMGIDAQVQSMRVFDEFFGLLMDSLGDEQVNLVIYADHGISTLTSLLRWDEPVERALEEDLLFAYYPNVYLRNPASADDAARRLADLESVDFAFFRLAQGVVAGWHKGGKVVFTSSSEGVSYSFEGSDPFGYYAAGYGGEAMPDREWLERTCHMDYPAVPVDIARFMANPLAGDVVVAINPPNGLFDALRQRAGHFGFSRSDLIVPVLLTGPDIDLATIPEAFWVHTLYRDILRIEPRNQKATVREPNSIALFASSALCAMARENHPPDAIAPPSGSGVELRLSPAPSARMILTKADDALICLAEASIHRDFLSRVWAGGGLAWSDHGIRLEGCPCPTPCLSGRFELFLGPLTAELSVVAKPSFTSASSRLRYDIISGFAIEWILPKSIGISLSW
ncbi:MAG: alkaline phosphatase family protein [Clostridia bacterium]|nr:alkaline phosphatase family protein [Clostridia bacterium]